MNIKLLLTLYVLVNNWPGLRLHLCVNCTEENIVFQVYVSEGCIFLRGVKGLSIKVAAEMARS